MTIISIVYKKTRDGKDAANHGSGKAMSALVVRASHVDVSAGDAPSA